MHICHEEILAVVNGIQSVWPGIVAYINRVRAWFHARKACKHAR